MFGRVDRSTYSTQLRANYTFKPDMTLDLYAEPFAASGRYDNIGELSAARSRLLRLYGTGGTTLTPLADGSLRVTDGDAAFVLPNRDFNVLSFRSNLVLRWEWRPGSTLYLVWQQDRAVGRLRREPRDHRRHVQRAACARRQLLRGQDELLVLAVVDARPASPDPPVSRPAARPCASAAGRRSARSCA